MVITDTTTPSWSSQYRYEYTTRTGSSPDFIYLDNNHCSHTSVILLYVTLAPGLPDGYCVAYVCSALRRTRRLPRLGAIFCRSEDAQLSPRSLVRCDGRVALTLNGEELRRIERRDDDVRFLLRSLICHPYSQLNLIFLGRSPILRCLLLRRKISPSMLLRCKTSWSFVCVVMVFVLLEQGDQNAIQRP